MIHINYRDPRPIYEQVKDTLRRMIVSQAIAAGERLPSVRELAAQNAVNPNTIQRAYRELEAEGYIYSVQGKGSFVGEGKEVDEKRKEVLLKVLDETVIELTFLDMTRAQLSERIMRGGKE